MANYSVYSTIKKIPGSEYAYKKLLTAKHLLTDLMYAYSPLTRKRLTPFGFYLLGGNSVHHGDMQKGTFEPREVALLRETYVNEYDVFVDVGANIGYFSLIARQANKHVIAIEPQQANLRYLYQNVMSNAWEDIEVFPVGLSNKPGVAVLFGFSSTGASLIPRWADNPRSFRTLIPLSTLDIILDHRFDDKRLLIKIDAEGVEYDVIQGAERILQRKPRPIWLVEITAREFYPDGCNPHFFEIFERFAKHGYTPMAVGDGCKRITQDDIQRLSNSTVPPVNGFNYLFL